MISKPAKAAWNFTYIIVIIGIGYFTFISSSKINYIWRWNTIPSYIIYTSHDTVSSPFNGFVEGYKNGELTIKSLHGVTKKFKLEKSAVKKGNVVDQGDELGYNVSHKAGALLLGLLTTLKISIIAIFFAIIIGIITGLMRIAENPLLKNLAITYIELIRGTPLLVQIFIFYFFIGTVFNLDRIVSGIGALAVFEGAYIAEIVRAGIQSIGKDQTEAALSIGMNYFQLMRHIIMPQAIKRTMPAMAGQFISLIKDSSLVSIISITDLTKAGREIVSSTFSPFEIWFTVAAMYLVLTYSLSSLTHLLERKMAKSDR
ncbi:MAG: amino acid ABC transporter permease [Epsilonproteobacteria bacterium]|nr:amino acid ABC transporter permease [Campylobacterota bacterium]